MNAAHSASTPMVSMEERTPLAQRAVAPAWHTVVVLLVLFGLSGLGALNSRLSPLGGPHSRVLGYIFVIVFEWVVAAFIAWGVRRRGIRISELVGGSWASAKDFLRDLGIAIAFLLVCGSGIVNGLGYLLKAAPNAAIRNMLPRSSMEVTLWLLMALTAGFCEELIFRGYLQRQFAALTKSVWSAIVLQGIAFGAGHGYQGWRLMLVIAVYGCLFGILAQWCRSLRPGMMAHFMQDGLGGLLARYMAR
jgi:uncharacterized protein